MDNNKNKNPLEELKQINARMTNGGTQRPAPAVNPNVQKPAAPAQSPAPQVNPSAQKPAAPAQRPVPQVNPNVQKPASAPAQRPAPAVNPNAQTPAPKAVPTPKAEPTSKATPVNNEISGETDDVLAVFKKPAETPDDGISRAEKVKAAREAGAMRNPQVPPVQPSDASLDHTRISSAVPVAPPPAPVPKSIPVPEKPTSGSAPATKKKPEVKTKDEKTNDDNIGRGIITSSVKAIIYIVGILIISGCLSLFAIFVGNDVFAFVKSDEEITVNIPAGSDLSDIAKILGDNDVIGFPSMFKLYINIRNKDADEYLSGDFTVSPDMPYDMLIAQFKPNASKRTELTVTIIEGMDVDEIIDLFIENGIGTKEGFVDVIQNYDFDFWFVDELDTWLANNPDSGRTYRLEGYLFPDTYNFYSNATEADVIYKLLVNFDAKFDEDKRTRAAELGYSCDEIVNLASIIQKEAKFISDYANVSSVFHNRLNTNVTGKKLESNATVQYTMPDEEVRLELTYAEIDKYDNAYNTYLYAGLPIGPISNPSLNAINMALYPAETDYYYFVSDASGANLYAKTSAEHDKNCDKVAAEAAAAADGE